MNPANRGRKHLFFGNCLNAIFPSIRRRNFLHSCPLYFHLQNYLSKNNEFPSQICDAVMYFRPLISFESPLLDFFPPKYYCRNSLLQFRVINPERRKKNVTVSGFTCRQVGWWKFVSGFGTSDDYLDLPVSNFTKRSLTLLDQHIDMFAGIHHLAKFTGYYGDMIFGKNRKYQCLMESTLNIVQQHLQGQQKS